MCLCWHHGPSEGQPGPNAPSRGGAWGLAPGDCHRTGRPQGPQLLHCEPRSFPDGGSEAKLPRISEGLLPHAGRRVASLRAQTLPQRLSVTLSGLPMLSGLSFPGCRMGTVTTELPPGGREDVKPEASAMSPDLAQAPHTGPSAHPPNAARCDREGEGVIPRLSAAALPPHLRPLPAQVAHRGPAVTTSRAAPAAPA